ncbi:MAG: chromosome segregation protein SMC [Phycisphaerae bacterium]
MKLRKLILSGFKSFADRTEFEFHDGISCVVGPNGCGKSNIVDAVKWVLGEQSAKSLRGDEMMDVIFNGSAVRRPAGSSEVTLVFDNSDGTLKPAPGDAQPTATEVSVTRRLYRSGQSEYLINKTICRLKDIREMFMDTGVGVDAYSLIEQGRVESFLQASQEDRRVIFDEAAGISKYKARRKEAMRKLEKVDQNLLRLGDILGEVEKRLRSIKYQAGKARNYQTYTQRLKELRSLFFLAQYHGLSAQRNDLRVKVDAGADNLASLATRIGKLETARNATEAESADLERAARELQGRIAAAGGLIAGAVQRAEMLEARVKELAEQIASGGAHCQELSAKIDSCSAEIAARAGELDQIDALMGDLTSRTDALRDEHTQGELAVTKLAAALEDEKAGTIDLLRRTAQIHNEIQGLNIRREGLSSQKSRLAARAAEIDATLKGTLTERAEIAAKLADVRELLAASQTRHAETRQARGKIADTEHSLQNQLAQARERRSAAQGRMETLRDLQQRLEGVGEGVRRVLAARAEGKVAAIVGMLGDSIETDVQHARLVEAALAGADQQLLAERFEDVQAASWELAEIIGDNGSVEILCMDRLEPFKDDFDLARWAGPAGALRIMDHVRCDAAAAPAVWRLLGRTLVVPTLADAATAAAVAPAGYRFVTAAGEVLEADGRVRLGSARRAAGVIMRRSQLADLAGEIKSLDARIEDLDRQCRLTRTEREHLDELDQSLRQAIYEASTERIECEGRVGQLDEQVAQLQREQPLVAGDIQRLAAEIESSVQAEHQAHEKAGELEQLNKQRQREVERLTAEIAAAGQRQAQLASQLTELKVAAAEAQQKRLAAVEAQASLARQREAMEKDLSAAKSQIELDTQRKADAEAGITAARCEVDRQRQAKQALESEAADVEESRRGLTEKLEQIRVQSAELRKNHDEAAAAVNELKVELGEVNVRIESLIATASEGGMNLLEAFANYQHDANRDWAAVEAEIADLRGKIERLGNVNIEAIAEQDELEKREQFLTAQLQDVKASQEQLNDLIRRLNKESREMFLKTFEAVRLHFQELFRKLFGGGKADIVLVNPEDVLESPIEVVARPPGKELRTLSLLSGGEKTMVALALLFSMFKTRPSPFCLLDEVDAAMDEANNRRFITLVEEFVATSQFIVISHSKRTMSMADVLYGVTMQEPGVSKRISVKFEDVGEKTRAELQPA